jgi:hypothetical protein
VSSNCQLEVSYLSRFRTVRGFAPCEASCPSRRVLAMLALMEGQRPSASLGTLPTELVLRGGLLKGPVVLTGLQIVMEKQFVVLRKTDKILNGFLTGLPASGRPLAHTLIMEKLQQLRNSKGKDLLAELQNPAGEEAGAIVPVVIGEVDDLGLDIPVDVVVSVHPVGKRLRGTSIRAARSQLPMTAVVSVERPHGSMWQPVLLLDVAHKAPAMECTAANFQALFELVQADLAEGTCHRKPYGSDCPLPVAKAPRRYPDGSREYWVRNKWVRKTKLANDSMPVVRKFRTLKRRSSDEVAAAAGKSARGRGRGRERKMAVVKARGKTAVDHAGNQEIAPDDLEL